MFINYLNHFISKRSQKVPLRTVIIVPFVIQIFAVVGLTGWLSFRNGQKAVHDLATQLRSEITTRIDQYLNSHTLIPYRANQMNVNVIELGLLNLNDINSLEHHLLQQIQQFKTVSYIGIGTEKATYVGVQRFYNGTVQLEILDQTTGGALEIWDTDSGKRTQLKTRLPNYDLRNQSWYIDAANAKQPVWSNKTDFSSLRTPLSINQPIYDNQDNLLAVATTDINVLEISQFLCLLKIGQSFIMERSGQMIATSISEKPDCNTKKPQIHLINQAMGVGQQSQVLSDQRPTIQTLTPYFQYQTEPSNTSQETLTQAAVHHLNQHFDDLNTIQNRQNLDFTNNGQKYFLQVKPFADKWGLDWLIVIMVPEADFMAHIDTNMYYTILLCLAALFVTILVGIFTAQWLIQPLLRLNTAAKALANGEWQQKVEVERQDEVGELAKSFKRMGKQLQEMFTALTTKNAELQRLDKLKDEFLANTSHELRTPLHGIIGIAESMIDGATGQLSLHMSEKLSMIVASGQRLSNLINDILDFSKQKHKKIELQCQPVDIRETAYFVLRFCQPLVGKKDLQLINAISPHIPQANADEKRVQQILHNLISNAIKFTDRGCIEISAEVRERIGENDIPRPELAMTVSDTGIGIPADKTTQVFELFEKIKNSVQRNGTGLGLAVTKQLVTLHGGEIWVTSTVGVGSQFTFTLPISNHHLSAISYQNAATKQPESVTTFVSTLKDSAPIKSSEVNGLTGFEGQSVDALASDDPNVDALAGSVAAPQGLIRPENEQSEIFKILIVDDEPVNLHVLTNHLSLYNYTIVQASSGFEALATLEKQEIPDLILLDVMMPRMTGYEVTQKIRERWEANELPIVLLTAKNQAADLVMGLEVGANDYLVKPISKSELIARIKTHLHIKQLKAETLRLAIESERRLTQFLEAVSVGVFVMDANGHPYYANHKAQQLLGKGVISEITVEQLASVYQIYLAGTEQLYPNDRQPAVLALQGKSVSVDDMEIHQSNQQIPVEAWGTPIFDEKGHITYAIIAFADITERKQAEAERERFNRQLVQLNKELEVYSHTLEGKVEERTHKLQKAKKEAENALQQLQATQQQLVEAAKMADLGNLVAGVAHEINTPIGIGVTAASRLETITKELTQKYETRQMKRADLEKYLKSTQQGNELILKNLTRAAELIQSFKQVAVDQTGDQPRTFALEVYLNEILMTLKPEFKRTKHQVSIICDSHITLSSYPGIFSQIFTNLIMNSLIHGFKTQPEGRMTITVLQGEGKMANTLTLRYSDNGNGIPANVINHIFDPFFTTNRQGGGSGLGLHIVFNLVNHKLKGNIRCESVEGEGTTFIIQIPTQDL
ncbi:MAG: guanylate cyclase [Candidatus Parabeggiatoa sp. nov. 1]|nr:MAG: guanylate cyclase [Gammaproteobacteria bacterium]